MNADTKKPRPERARLVTDAAGSAARGDFQFVADVIRDLVRIVVNEMADAVAGDAAKLRPFAQGADRGLPAARKNSAATETGDVSERIEEGRCRWVRFHTSA